MIFQFKRNYSLIFFTQEARTVNHNSVFFLDNRQTESIYLGLLPKYRIDFRMPLGDSFDIGQDTSGMDGLELPSANDFAILRAMGDDDDTQNISFQGIKRKLGLHQETLSRALRRLQRDGYVERLEHAYRISQKGISTISQVQPRMHPLVANDPYSVPCCTQSCLRVSTLARLSTR